MSDHVVSTGALEGFETVTLSSLDADLHAGFAPRAGMIGCSLRHAGEELLERRGGLAEYARTGATMGIPILHPWANRLAGFDYRAAGREVTLDPDSALIGLDPNGLPIHGLLAASPRWRLLDAAGGDGGAQLRAELDFGAHVDLLAAFPYPHVLALQIRLEGAELTIRTTITATGDVEVPVSFGFHPYLRLPGAPRERWEVELPVRSRLVLNERMIPTGERQQFAYPRQPLGQAAFDDGFADLVPPREFVLAAAGRELTVAFLEGYPFAQVYSPKGAEFICFEPMTAPTNALSENGDSLPLTRPAESFSAAFRIAVATA